VLISSTPEANLRDEAERVGADCGMLKPQKPEAPRAAIRAVVGTPDPA
jgi:hypothetical protein